MGAGANTAAVGRRNPFIPVILVLLHRTRIFGMDGLGSALLALVGSKEHCPGEEGMGAGANIAAVGRRNPFIPVIPVLLSNRTRIGGMGGLDRHWGNLGSLRAQLMI